MSKSLPDVKVLPDTLVITCTLASAPFRLAQLL